MGIAYIRATGRVLLQNGLDLCVDALALALRVVDEEAAADFLAQNLGGNQILEELRVASIRADTKVLHGRGSTNVNGY